MYCRRCHKNLAVEFKGLCPECLAHFEAFVSANPEYYSMEKLGQRQDRDFRIRSGDPLRCKNETEYEAQQLLKRKSAETVGHLAAIREHVSSVKVIEVRRQGDVFKIKVPQPARKDESDHTRSSICEFSRASRKRFMEKIQTLDKNELGSPVFITLTYGQTWPTIEESKRNLRAFMRRIERKFPRSSGFWRLEFQERGAPHYHLVVFGLDKKGGKWPLNMDTVNAWWGEIIDYNHWDHSGFQARPPLTGIESLHCWKRLVYYVSKYMAKVNIIRDGEDGAAVGGDGQPSAPLFIYGAYLDGLHPFGQSVGRYWGTFGGKNLPTAELESVLLEWGSWFNDIWHMARFGMRFLTRADQGFSMFSGNSAYWFDRSITAREQETLEKITF